MSHTETEAAQAWIRVLPFDDGAWVGLVGDELFVGDYESPKRRIDPEDPIGLLPCLEKPRRVVQDELRAREVELRVVEGSVSSKVPLDAIPAAAVASEMDYWVELALDWLAQRPGDVATERLLNAIEHADWATQRARHRARKLRRQG